MLKLYIRTKQENNQCHLQHISKAWEWTLSVSWSPPSPNHRQIENHGSISFLQPASFPYLSRNNLQVKSKPLNKSVQHDFAAGTTRPPGLHGS
jgi:hypothetical protein